MSAAHTPGPWKLHFWTENIGISTDRPKPRDCETVALVAREAELGPFHADVLRHEADARLMAAAPEGLSANLTALMALECIEAILNQPHASSAMLPADRALALVNAKGAIADLRAAIAKARGK